MSTKKVARLEQKQAEQYERDTMSATRRVGLMAVLATALAGPMAATPVEDPRRPRDLAAWTPMPTGSGKKGRRGTGNLNSGPSAGTLEGDQGPAKPTVYHTGEVKVDPNLYVRKVRNDAGLLHSEAYEFGNRLKDRKRELEALMRQLGLKVSHRQVKRILRGFMPPVLVAWLDAQKALAE